MLSNYWKNKQEEKGGLEELQNLYKDEVMKYKLSNAAGEHYYSTMFKPITEKLEETIEPLKEIASEERRRLLPPPIPAAIEYKEPEEEYEEAYEEPEEAYEEPEEVFEEPDEIALWEYRPNEGIDLKILKDYDLKLPSQYKHVSEEEKSRTIRKIGTVKANITKKIKLLQSKDRTDSNLEQLSKLGKDYKHLDILSERLKGMRRYLKTGKGFRQQLISSIDIPLLKKQKFLLVKDKQGNPLLSGKVSKGFVDLVTKRFNSKKKYKGSSIETFKLLNKLSSMPINKRSKKVRFLNDYPLKPIFYDDPKDLIDHLDLILGAIEAGNNNLKNEGIAVLDELLKLVF